MQETTYQIPDLPADMAVLADLHEKIHPSILPSLERHRPSLILVPGDFILGHLFRMELRMKDSPVLPFFSSLAGLAPVFVSLGNHEWMLAEEDMALIRETGARLLDNSYVSLDGICLGGLTSGNTMEYRRIRDRDLKAGIRAASPYLHKTDMSGIKKGPDVAWLKAFAASPGYKVLLCHHPEYYEPHLKAKPIDLVVSGHAHGGQWNFYWPPTGEWRGVFAPGQGLFPRYTSGVREGRLVISRGLTNTERFIPRFFNPTEIVYLSPLS